MKNKKTEAKKEFLGFDASLPREMPKQSLGDVVDKMSILTQKLYAGEEEAAQELNYLVKKFPLVDISGELVASIIRLAQMNMGIWYLENEIRKHGETIPLAEVGERALAIRDFNKKRVRHKNEINRLTGLGFKEFKIKHRSQ